MTQSLNHLEGVRIPLPNKNILHAWYKFYCFLLPEKLSPSWNRSKILETIQKKGYPAFEGGCSEVYLEKCFKNVAYEKKGNLKNAVYLGKSSYMFLVHPTISIDEMHLYSKTISNLFINDGMGL